MFSIKNHDGQTVYTTSRWIDAVALTDDDQVNQCAIHEGEITWRYMTDNTWHNPATGQKRAAAWTEPTDED